MIRKFSGLILYLLITIFVITIYLDQPMILGKWEMAVYDKLFQLRGKKEVQDDIQIVAIDDISVQMVGRWPWHRNKVADLVDKISKQNPKVIYLDIPFVDDRREDSLGYTTALADKIKKAGNVILPYRYSVADFSATGFTLPEYIRATTFVQFDDREKLEDSTPLAATSIYPPPALLAEAAAGLGFTGVSFDADRYIRTEPMVLKYAGDYLPSVPVAVATKYIGLTREALKVHVDNAIELPPRLIPIDGLGRMRINFSGPPGAFKHISAAEILNETIGKRELSGKIVLIAYTAAGTVDLYSTPVAQSIHGVEILANAIENIIHDNFLKGLDKSGLINLVMILCIGLFSAIILPRISLMYRFVVLGVSLFVIANLSFVLFTSFDIVTKVFYPMIMIFFFIIGAPTMKLPQAGADDEESEIDYDAILAGTPLAGLTVGMAQGGSPSGAQRAGRKAANQTVGSTMPIQSGSNGLPAGASNFGRYKVLEPIGRGAMGMVYKGLDPAIDRPVALKTIRLDNIVNSNDMFELKERLTREAKAAGQLSHPNIVTIYDVGEERSLQYIAMEYLDGQTLEALLEAGHQWDYKTLCKLMIQVCEALDFAHDRGIVHRDIKPANIMILGDDRIKVMDFGIARFDQSNITQSGVALGTPNYISPEQLKGQAVDRRSDLFSLGVVFYELLTSQKPFKGDTISALIYSILHTTPPPPSEINLDVPRIFDKIVAKALAKDPDIRFQTAREMADILRKLI